MTAGTPRGEDRWKQQAAIQLIKSSSKRLTDVSAPWDNQNFTGTDFHSHSASEAYINTSRTESIDTAPSRTKDWVVQQTWTNSPLIISNFCLPGATRVANSTRHWAEEAVLRMAVTAFPLLPLFNVPAKCISVTHCKISCWDFFYLSFKGTHVCIISYRDSLSPHCNCTETLSLQNLLY